MPSAPRIRLEKKGAVALLRIENPPRNSLRLAMITEIADRVQEVEKDDAVRAAVVTGDGPFCSGLEMEEWAGIPAKEAQEWITRGQDAFWALEHLTKPTLAAVVGPARGAGAELAFACDLRIADETAAFSLPEIDLGWMPSHGGTARVSKLVGRSKALELLLSGKEIRGLDALRLGLVDHLATPGQAVDQALGLAAAFGEKPRAAVKAIKRTLIEGDEKPYRNRFLLESQHAVQLLWTDEYKERMAKIRRKAP